MRGADKINTGLARRLRRDSTNAELRLWNKLRARSIDSHKFVRQQTIGRYIVDFICREKRLIVEVDGRQHAESARDLVRDQYLCDRNYRVVRFWNNDIISNMDGVLETIATALRGDTPPTRLPPPAGTDLSP